MSVQSRWFIAYLAVFAVSVCLSFWIFVSRPELGFAEFSKVMMLTALLPSAIGLTIGIRTRLFERTFRYATLASIVAAIYALWLVTGVVAMLGLWVEGGGG
ncbi:hypothetical protein KQH82_05280 [bacterium]|nr:hypothetical protein [bacterium]